ncbi:hypothetical protein SUGI_0181890 [Cryptomeria japonica]|nr:hypothetical protein SUGI_0181890 [Cryptomeria japonica]
MHDFCFTFPYGALVAIGGLVGFMRKGSVTSLAGGLGAGFFLLLAAQMSLNAFNQRRNSYLALFIQTVCSFALTWVMGQRYLVTSKIMPGGVVATIRRTNLSIATTERRNSVKCHVLFDVSGTWIFGGLLIHTNQHAMSQEIPKYLSCV